VLQDDISNMYEQLKTTYNQPISFFSFTVVQGYIFFSWALKHVNTDINHNNGDNQHTIQIYGSTLNSTKQATKSYNKNSKNERK